MTIELLAMLGGGITGFLMRFMAAQSEAQARALDHMIAAQAAADDSADRAAGRGGVIIRRFIAVSIVFAVIFAPFLLSLFSVPVTVESEKEWWDIFGVFSGGWEQVQGFVLLPEVRQGMLALIGFYFGSSQVRR